MKSILLNILIQMLRNVIVLFILCFNFAIYSDQHKHFKYFEDVIKKIEHEYITPLDRQKLIDSALQGVLSSLDQYCAYMIDDELDNFFNNTKGEFGGIGMEFVNDYSLGVIRVMTTIDDLPAHKAGIKSGDYVVKVDDETINNLGFSKALKKIKGEPGTKVKLTVIREGIEHPIEYILVREIVKTKPVKIALDNKIMYIRITVFNEKTMSDLEIAVNKLIADNNKTQITGIVLDLRNNPGGLLNQAVAVAEYFVDDGVIVTVKGKSESNKQKQVYMASKSSIKAPKIPLIVLINKGSASGSEIVAGAIQDHRRGIILGTQSFGKGVVQTVTTVNQRAAIKMTTAYYYTPNNTKINEIGIKPDIIVVERVAPIAHTQEKSKDKKHEVPTELQSYVETNQNLSSQMYKDDYQYARAYDLLVGLNIIANNK